MLEGLKRQGWPLSLLLAGIVGGVAGLASARPFEPLRTPASRASDEGLPSFASEDQFREFLRGRKAAVDAQRRSMRYSDDAVMMEVATDAAAASTGESITNTQEAGVDEGGIVKSAGDHLIVLRRGRLFTLSIADGGLRAIDQIDVPPPGTPAPKDSWSGAWYDEMLVVDGYVVVIGYSYEKAGTEIVRFRLSPDGRLAFHDVSRLRASDYYSAENYASRLIGDELVMYNVRGFDGGERPDEVLPALTDETPGRTPATRVLARAEDVFIDPNARASNLAYSSLHSVTRCDLTAPRLDCSATAVLGPWSRTFYVSPRAIYLWTTSYDDGEGRAPATVYRLPMDGGRPQAVRVSGAPLDQFSFREDPARGRLDVVVQSDEGGDAMWSRRDRGGSVALLSLPLARFGDGTGRAARGDYRELPGLATNAWQRENRFVGDHLLYAVGTMDETGEETGGTLLTTRVDGDAVRTFNLPSPVSRIEVMGEDALIVTQGRGGLALTAVELDGPARLGARYAVAGVGESEGRSHGFFFRPDQAGAASGVFGLPIQKFPPSDSRHTEWAGRVEMMFLRRDRAGFTGLGALNTGVTRGDDGCRVSCVDWYGQARPIFLRGRVFALMGYELVEGRIEDGRIREIGRVDFTPRRA